MILCLCFENKIVFYHTYCIFNKFSKYLLNNSRFFTNYLKVLFYWKIWGSIEILFDNILLIYGRGAKNWDQLNFSTRIGRENFFFYLKPDTSVSLFICYACKTVWHHHLNRFVSALPKSFLKMDLVFTLLGAFCRLSSLLLVGLTSKSWMCWMKTAGDWPSQILPIYCFLLPFNFLVY